MWKSLWQQDCDEIFIDITTKEKAKLAAESAIVICILNMCFYRSRWAFLPLLIPGVFCYRELKRGLTDKKRTVVREQFKELLMLVVAAQRAGYSIENAFLGSYEDLKGLYGQDSPVCKMISFIGRGLSNHIPVTELWETIGNKCQIAEIIEFAEVFHIAKMSGGNMTAILQNTAEIIEQKAETKKEIETFLSARRFEQKIMTGMPFVLMLYVEVTSPGYFDGMYHNLSGIVIMSISLFVYLLAFLWGKRLAEIEV